MTKLAFWRTVGAAYNFAFTDARRLVGAAGAWIVGLTLLALPVQWLVPKASLAAGLVAFADALLYLTGLAVFAAKWHRAVLLNETVSGSDALRIGRRELRFLGYAILILLIVGGVLFVAGTIVFLPVAMLLGYARGGGLAATAFYLFEAMIYIVLGAVVARLALALPAAALDEAGDVLDTAWQRSRGNGLRLCLGTILCMLPFALAQRVLDALFGGPLWLMGKQGVFAAVASSPAVQLALAALMLMLYFLAIAVTTGFFSIAYRQLAPGTAPRDGMAPSGALPAV